MKQKLVVNIFTLADQCLNDMKGDIRFFSSSEDKKTLAPLTICLKDKNSTHQNIVDVFEQVNKTSSNPSFKERSQAFLAKVTRLENYARNNTKYPPEYLFSFFDVTNRIFNFIPHLKSPIPNSQTWMPNLFWLTQLSLVCKRAYLAVRMFRKSPEFEKVVDVKPRVTRFPVEPIIGKSCEDLIIEPARDRPSVVTSLEVECGYCELDLTASELESFEKREIKIKLEGCSRAYVSVNCIDCGASSKLYPTPISYYYIDNKNKQFIALADKRDLSSSFLAILKLDNWINHPVFTNKKEAIKNRYQEFLSGSSPAQKMVKTATSITVSPMILSMDEWLFFNNHCSKNAYFKNNEHSVAFTVVEEARTALLPKCTQKYTQTLNLAINPSAGQTFLHLDEGKLYLFYSKKRGFLNSQNDWYLNEWNLHTDQRTVHKLNLSQLRIFSRDNDWYCKGRTELPFFMHWLNSRYAVLSFSTIILWESTLIPRIHNTVYRDTTGIIVYDFKNAAIIFEKYFRLASGTYSNSEFIDELPDYKVNVSIPDHRLILDGNVSRIVIDFPVPLSETPVFYELVPHEKRPIATTEKQSARLESSRKEVSQVKISDAQHTNIESKKLTSSDLSPLEVAFYLGFLFLLIAAMVLGVTAATFSFVWIPLILSGAFAAGFLIGYTGEEIFLENTVSNEENDQLSDKDMRIISFPPDRSAVPVNEKVERIVPNPLNTETSPEQNSFTRPDIPPKLGLN